MISRHSLRIVGKKRRQRRVNQPVKAIQLKNHRVENSKGELITSKHSFLSMLLPPAVKEFYAELEAELEALCGARYSRRPGRAQRWGSQRGSIVLGTQRVSIQVPRVRDAATGKEIQLQTYRQYQDESIFDEAVFQEGIRGVSQRNYDQGVRKIAASFGTSKSKVSKSWVRATAKQFNHLMTRDIGPMKIAAAFIDGKRFSKMGVVLALGVGADGRKHVLGLYQCSTEHSESCLNLLNDLEGRGLPASGMLFVVDGGSGLNKALDLKYAVADVERRLAYRVRCYVHKWENIKSSLDKKAQGEARPLFAAIRGAKDLTQALACSDALEACLKRHNQSALKSYQEAKADLLNIHRLMLSPELKRFFSTTNAIESLNSLLEEGLRRVKRWRNSEHFQRWLATACLESEKRMRRINGAGGLQALLVSLSQLSIGEENLDRNSTAA